MSSILIVDDEKDTRDLLSKFLQKAGLATRTAPNGQLALAAIGTVLPDVVLLDWMMPEMDGISFLEVVRSYLRWKDVPVILITAFHGPHVDRAWELGVKHVFFKPDYDLQELLVCIQKLLRDPKTGCKSAG